MTELPFFIFGHKPNGYTIEIVGKYRDVKRMKAVILEKYGFEPTDRYCLDLMAFVERMGELANDNA